MTEEMDRNSAIRENEDVARSRKIKYDEFESNGSPFTRVVTLESGFFSFLGIHILTSDTFKKFMLIVLGTIFFLSIGGVVFFQKAPEFVAHLIYDVFEVLFLLLLAILRGIYWVLWVNDWTSLPIITGVVFYVAATKIRNIDHAVFWVLSFDGLKDMRLRLYDKHYDTVRRPFIAVPTGFWYKLIYGPAIFPFHESMQNASLDYLNLTVEYAGGGLRPTEEWSGEGLILQTDPRNGKGDDEELADIFKFIKVPTEDPERFNTELLFDTSRTVPPDLWRKIWLGMEVEYYKAYIQSQQKLQVIARELQVVQYGGSLKLMAEFYPTYEGLAAQSRGEDLASALIEDFRSFDDAGSLIQKLLLGGD